MTSPHDHTDRYSRQLLVALRGREVPGDRAAEVVAEVESHVAETGEDPREAFGEPGAYAAEVAGQRRLRVSTLVAVVLGGLTGWLAASLVFRLVSGEGDVLGLGLPVATVLTLVLVAVTAAVAQRHHRPVVDPRDGRRRLSGGGTALVLVLAGALAAVAATAAAGRLLG